MKPYAAEFNQKARDLLKSAPDAPAILSQIFRSPRTTAVYQALLERQAYTTRQLMDLGLPESTVYYGLKQLRALGLIRVVGTVRFSGNGGPDAKVWRATR